MKRTIIALAVSSALVFSGGEAFAQKGPGGGQGKGRVAQPGPKTHGGGGGMQQGPKGASGAMTRTPGPKHTATPGSRAKGSPGGGAAAHAPRTAKGPATTTKTTTTTTTNTTTVGTNLTLTPVQQKLQRNTNLASKLESRLPAGTNLITAAAGFRNLGQFVAAVNVSNNLGLSFTQLKSRMVDDGMSLGQAIQSLRRDVDATTTVRRAETDAARIIDESERATSATKSKTKIKKDGDR